MVLFGKGTAGRLTAPNRDSEHNGACPMYSVKRNSPVPCAIAIDDRSEAMLSYMRLIQFPCLRLTLNFSFLHDETVMSAINSGFWINWGILL
jgi:hypothetical protein